MSASEGAAHVDEKAREDSFERHRSGKRLMRRRQVEVIGNATSPGSWVVAWRSDRTGD
jgi:hypothetical protein